MAPVLGSARTDRVIETVNSLERHSVRELVAMLGAR